MAKYPTWQWIAGIAIAAVGTMVLLAFADTRDQLKNKADKSTVDKLEYRVNAMDDKLDMLIWMHVDKDGNPINKRK